MIIKAFGMFMWFFLFILSAVNMEAVIDFTDLNPTLALPKQLELMLFCSIGFFVVSLVTASAIFLLWAIYGDE